jgi:hypothetical protein
MGMAQRTRKTLEPATMLGGTNFDMKRKRGLEKRFAANRTKHLFPPGVAHHHTLCPIYII